MANARIFPDRPRTQAEINRAYVERYDLVKKSILINRELFESAKALAAENDISFTYLIECLLKEATAPDEKPKRKRGTA